MSLDNATLNMAYCWIFFGTGKVAYTSTGTPSSPGEDPRFILSTATCTAVSVTFSVDNGGRCAPSSGSEVVSSTPYSTLQHSYGGGGANGGFLGVCESTPSPSSQGGGMHTVSVGPSGPTTK